MLAQVLSSLAAAAALAAAAVVLGSPMSLLILSAICMIAWLSHMPNASHFAHQILTAIGLIFSVALWFYLFYLAL